MKITAVTSGSSAFHRPLASAGRPRCRCAAISQPSRNEPHSSVSLNLSRAPVPNCNRLKSMQGVRLQMAPGTYPTLENRPYLPPGRRHITFLIVCCTPPMCKAWKATRPPPLPERWPCSPQRPVTGLPKNLSLRRSLPGGWRTCCGAASCPEPGQSPASEAPAMTGVASGTVNTLAGCNRHSKPVEATPPQYRALFSSGNTENRRRSPARLRFSED